MRQNSYTAEKSNKISVKRTIRSFTDFYQKDNVPVQLMRTQEKTTVKRIYLTKSNKSLKINSKKSHKNKIPDFSRGVKSGISGGGV